MVPSTAVISYPSSCSVTASFVRCNRISLGHDFAARLSHFNVSTLSRTLRFWPLAVRRSVRESVTTKLSPACSSRKSAVTVNTFCGSASRPRSEMFRRVPAYQSRGTGLNWKFSGRDRGTRPVPTPIRPDRRPWNRQSRHANPLRLRYMIRSVSSPGAVPPGEIAVVQREEVGVLPLEAIYDSTRIEEFAGAGPTYPGQQFHAARRGLCRSWSRGGRCRRGSVPYRTLRWLALTHFRLGGRNVYIGVGKSCV